MKRYTIQTTKRTEFIKLDHLARNAVKEEKLQNGILIVFIPHTTAGVTINENADPDVLHDVESALEKIVPWSGHYLHVEGNSPAHVKASLVGSSVSVIVENGELQLGTWQSVYFCEFDGPRQRTVFIKALHSS